MQNTPLKALIFDVDGTIADTERFHLAAFNEAFAAEGLEWHWDEPLYTRLLEISGGKERILHYWNETYGHLLDVDGAGVRDTVERLHLAKTAAYEAMVHAGLVELRPGVLALMDEAAARGLQLAIATTTSPANVAALLRRAMGTHWRLSFSSICDASTAPVKKPHPQVYRQVLKTIGLHPGACLAFEDSRNGLSSACAAGISTLVTPTRFTAHQDFGAALRVVDDLAGVRVEDLLAWREQAVKARAAEAV